jgi:hypothetical protein
MMATLLSVAFIGSRLTSLEVRDRSTLLLLLGLLAAMFAPLPVWFHQQGKTALRDASLMVPWCIVLAFILPLPFLVGARLGMPLQDGLFASIDRAFGIHGESIVLWSANHWLGNLINRSYAFLTPYLAAAIFIPALTGKREAKHFLLANLIAVAIAAPLFALAPAVGPWYGEHFTARPSQHFVEMQITALRHAVPYTFSIISDGSSIVSFPSFHVIFAIFAASAFWGFRRLRIPASVLTCMIIASTVTTGWHYFADVLGGIAVATISLCIAARLTTTKAERKN